MAKAEGCHQGLCPHSIQEVFRVFVVDHNSARKRCKRKPVSAGKTCLFLMTLRTKGFTSKSAAGSVKTCSTAV